MFNKKLLFFFISFVLVTATVFAQQDTTTVEDDDDFFSENHDNHWWKNWDENWMDWEFRGTPFIEVNYGLGNFNQKNMTYDFAKVGSGELKLGYSTRQSFFEERIIDFKDHYFFISRLGSDMEGTTAKANELRSSMWRFGFSSRSGYGYKLGDLYILPYNASGIVWARIDIKDFPPSVWPAIYPPLQTQLDAEADNDFLNRIDKTFRFGTSAESGINFDFDSKIGFNVGYETSVLFPRHMFWKHAGSWLIEAAGMGLLDHFIDQIGDSSPLSLPFVNAILKGAYQFAFYSLKKEKMNWPFNTEAPLTYETFKFGVTFTF